MEQDGKSIPPWTDNEVESFNQYQASGVFHEFTCANREHGGDDVLVATSEMLSCPSCSYRQHWCHPWMVDWKWKKMADARFPESNPSK